jgi:hypothetical protein
MESGSSTPLIPGSFVSVDIFSLQSRKEPDMGDISDEQIGREARDAVSARRPTTGENRVQAAMRRYLGAVASRTRDKEPGENENEKPDDKPRPKG